MGETKYTVPMLLFLCLSIRLHSCVIAWDVVGFSCTGGFSVKFSELKSPQVTLLRMVGKA